MIATSFDLKIVSSEEEKDPAVRLQIMEEEEEEEDPSRPPPTPTGKIRSGRERRGRRETCFDF